VASLPSTSLFKKHVVDRFRDFRVTKELPPMPVDSAVPVERAEDVLLLCSGYLERRHLQTHVQELAFAHELASRGRAFALTDDPSTVFDRRVAWFLPGAFVRPRLWDYSRQAVEFAAGLELQGNSVFCSSAEVAYWENKAHMHAQLAASGISTPRTLVATSENRDDLELAFDSVIVKEEHSAGSAGIHWFPTAEEANRFVRGYPLRPGEALIVQEAVRGATRDMRLTMVGGEMVDLASYWRIKSPEALARSEWTPTATKYNSQVVHGDIPEHAVRFAANCLSAIGVRNAGCDLIWLDDDFDSEPLLLELSPYFQPNPPKPARYDNWTYKQFKQNSHVSEGYLTGQYRAFREIARLLMEQELF
jgi:glutathione synthase/RimK-type ligase-like ATP-grasp enzyme